MGPHFGYKKATVKKDGIPVRPILPLPGRGGILRPVVVDNVVITVEEDISEEEAELAAEEAATEDAEDEGEIWNKFSSYFNDCVDEVMKFFT
jgi:hypothetical protein